MRFTILILTILFLTFAAQAHSYKVGAVSIGHAWMRAVPEGSTMGSAYMPLLYSGKDEDFDVLLSAETPVADMVSFHNTVMKGDVAEMVEVKKMVLVANRPIPMQPKGVHLMLMGIKKPIAKGKKVPMTLNFQKSGKVDIELMVEDVAASQGSH